MDRVAATISGPSANLQHPHILPLHDSGAADGLLYYVMPYVEGESIRDQEIGVRMALGASRRILRMVLNEGTMQLGVGTVLGLVLGYALAKPLSFVTYGVSLADPFLYFFILGTLGVVGLIACFVPARSATRSDPVSAMRAQ